MKYSQNQLKLVKSRFTELKNEYPPQVNCPRSLSGTDNQLFGRIISSVITEREQLPCLHLSRWAENVFRLPPKLDLVTGLAVSGPSWKDWRLSCLPAVVYVMRADGVERGCETRHWVLGPDPVAGTSTCIWKHRQVAEVCPVSTA